MTNVERIAAIKKLLFGAEPTAPVAAPAAVPPAPAPVAGYTLQDGTPVSIDNLAVGGKVVINGVPALDGSYTLADGTTLTTVGGAITDIDLPADGSAAPAAMAAFKVEFNSLKTEFAAFKTASATLSTEFAAAKEQIVGMDKVIKTLFELVEQLAQPVGEPAAQPAGFKNEKPNPPASVKKWEDMTPLERRRAEKAEA